MLENVLTAWKEYVGNNRINVSGEIVLNNVIPEQPLTLSEESETRIKDLVKSFVKTHGTFKITTVKKAGDFTIKIQADDAYTAKTTFMEDFQQDLTEFLRALLQEKNLTLHLDVQGEFTTLENMRKFHYLNQGEQVQYKVTETKPASTLSKIFRRSVRMYLLIILVVAILIWQESLIH